MTQPFESYRPADDDPHAHDEDLEWAYEDEAYAAAPRVLWGRVGLLAGMLLVAFLLGRMTGGGGASEEELTRAQDRVSALRADNEELQGALDNARQQLIAAEAAAETAPAEDAAAEDGETTEGTAETSDATYAVGSGETLTMIAEKCYGNAVYDDYLAEANGISDPTQLAVGQELTIPAHPDVEQISC